MLQIHTISFPLRGVLDLGKCWTIAGNWLKRIEGKSSKKSRVPQHPSKNLTRYSVTNKIYNFSQLK